jgi:hypothetical protein
LRVTGAVSLSILCVVLTAIWVRSYWWADVVWYRPTNSVAFNVMSHEGAFTFTELERNSLLAMGSPPSLGWSHREYWYKGYRGVTEKAMLARVFRGFHNVQRSKWQAPYWLCMLLLVLAGFVLHYFQSFSLRTLLVWTTVVTAVLGLVAIMARS